MPGSAPDTVTWKLCEIRGISAVLDLTVRGAQTRGIAATSSPLSSECEARRLGALLPPRVRTPPKLLLAQGLPRYVFGSSREESQEYPKTKGSPRYA